MTNYGKGVAIDILLVSMAASVGASTTPARRCSDKPTGSVLGYPLMVFPCRDAIDGLFFGSRKPNYVRTAVTTMLIITLTYAIAALIPKFSTILGLSGSITKTILAYILPPLFYWKASQAPFRQDPLKWLSLCLVVLGSLAGSVSAYITILDFVSGKDVPTNA